MTFAVIRASIASNTPSTPAPTIVVQPANSNGIATGNATFTCVASGATSYQWQINTGSGWSNISGETSTIYKRSSLVTGDNGYQFRCIATNGTGSTNSNAATLTIVSASDKQSVSAFTIETFTHFYPPLLQEVSAFTIEVFTDTES